MKVLSRIESPADLKLLRPEELITLCEEIREYLISIIPNIGGHFASSLGAVELTVGLHYIFNAPRDKMLWDVGHQGYVHKILTGRRDALQRIRQYGGISGFLRRTESEYDVFGAGHASTAISAAVGVATARDLNHEDFKVVAVVGDGGMTGGLAYEALNNAGTMKRDLIVILNDNTMSISPNVGAISHYLANVVSNPMYNKLRDEIWALTGKMPETVAHHVRELAARMEENVKNLVLPGMLFEDLGFNYVGPIDGHDLSEVIRILRNVRAMRGPVLIHALTRKGKGYEQAEADPVTWHGVKARKQAAPRSASPEVPAAPSYSDVFARTVTDIARENPAVVAITAAMAEGTGLAAFREELPGQFFDVGIAEAHAVTFAAGLATEGIRPVVAIYSTFLQRAYDQVIHDVAIQDLPVIFCLDRGGLAGEDGHTHHGYFDLTYLQCIPNLIVAAPKDGAELRNLIHTAIAQTDHPFAIRFPKESSIRYDRTAPYRAVPVGSWERVHEGTDAVILAVGAMVHVAIRAREVLAASGVQVGVVNCRFVKPLDTAMLGRLASQYPVVVTLEENVLTGGFGSTIGRYFESQRWTAHRLLHLGLPDTFITHGPRGQLLEDVGLTPAKVATRIDQCLAARPEPAPRQLSEYVRRETGAARQVG